MFGVENVENKADNPFILGRFGKKFLSFPQPRLWRLWKTQPFFFRTFTSKTHIFRKNAFFRAPPYCLVFWGF